MGRKCDKKEGDLNCTLLGDKRGCDIIRVGIREVRVYQHTHLCYNLLILDTWMVENSWEES